MSMPRLESLLFNFVVSSLKLAVVTFIFIIVESIGISRKRAETTAKSPEMLSMWPSHFSRYSMTSGKEPLIKLASC